MRIQLLLRKVGIIDTGVLLAAPTSLLLLPTRGRASTSILLFPHVALDRSLSSVAGSCWYSFGACHVLLQVTAIACVAVLAGAILCYYLLQNRPVYLVDFSVFKPEDSWTVPYEVFMHNTHACKRFSPENIDFQVRTQPSRCSCIFCLKMAAAGWLLACSRTSLLLNVERHFECRLLHTVFFYCGIRFTIVTTTCISFPQPLKLYT